LLEVPKERAGDDSPPLNGGQYSRSQQGEGSRCNQGTCRGGACQHCRASPCAGVCREWRREIARGIAAEFSGSPREKWQAAMESFVPLVGDSVDLAVLRHSEEAFDFNVTGCRFADFFRQVGEPELGFALLCAFDDTVVEEIGTGEVELKRTGTIMQGAQHCDFRYALRRRTETK
jgi:hypothetical protein